MIKVIIFQGILLLVQIVLYFGSENFQKNPHDVQTKADEYIPFMPWTAWIYILWFPLIALFPLALYGWGDEHYYVYISGMVFEMILSIICYMIYPTTFTRPVPPDTPNGKLMKRVYQGSYKGLNCAPSLHCSSCYLIMYTAIGAVMLPMPVQVISGVVAFLIVLSTMTTKQHALVDALSAIPVAVLGIVFGHLFPMVKWI